MKLKSHISLISASILTLASVITPTTSVQANSAEAFVCKQSNGTWRTIYQDGRIEKPFIRWVSDFGGLAGYSRERRCKEVTNRLNTHIKNQRPFYMTHGRTLDGKYPIICRTDFEGGGCNKKDDLIYTLDPESRTPPQVIMTELLEIVKPDVSPTIGVPATSCPLYINVRLYLQGKPSAKYVCRTR